MNGNENKIGVRSIAWLWIGCVVLPSISTAHNSFSLIPPLFKHIVQLRTCRSSIEEGEVRPSNGEARRGGRQSTKDLRVKS